MRDYTYYQGARFTINNIFRSERFDVDRLDMSWVDDEKPIFSRGLRIVDHQEGNTEMVDGDDADSLLFSMANISSKETTKSTAPFDQYLGLALKEKEFLVTRQMVTAEKKSEETLLH